MSEVSTIREAEGVLRHFFVEQDKSEFTHSFGNTHDHVPDFNIHDELPVWHEAAHNLHFSIEIEILADIGESRMKIRKVVEQAS